MGIVPVVTMVGHLAEWLVTSFPAPPFPGVFPPLRCLGAVR